MRFTLKQRVEQAAAGGSNPPNDQQQQNPRSQRSQELEVKNFFHLIHNCNELLVGQKKGKGEGEREASSGGEKPAYGREGGC